VQLGNETGILEHFLKNVQEHYEKEEEEEEG